MIRLEIVTNIMFEGDKVGEVLVKDTGKHATGFGLTWEDLINKERSVAFSIKSMEGTLKKYDSLIEVLMEEGNEYEHQMFKGHLNSCGYISRYDPNTY